jgi:hypothetical protein
MQREGDEQASLQRRSHGCRSRLPGLLPGIMRLLPFLRTAGTQLPYNQTRKIVLLVRTFHTAWSVSLNVTPKLIS